MQERPYRRGRLNLGQDLDSLLQSVSRECQDLLRKTRSLPRLEGDGSSECPFAEELYFQKQEAENKVIGSMATLQNYLSAVEKELARCKRNLQVISSQATLLNNDDPKRQFTAAEADQAREYQSYVRIRERIVGMIEKVRAVLAETQRKQYPGGARDKWGNPGWTGIAPPDDKAKPSIGDELEHLLALGPFGKQEFKDSFQ